MSSVAVKIDQKVYRNSICAIRELNFSVRNGEVVAIVGPSGAGKTTLLNIIAGIDTQFKGVVSLNGVGQGQKSSHQPGISFMFQDARLLPWLTVQQNIELVLVDDSPALYSRMLSLLQSVSLKDVTDQYPGQLSGGMRRRVSLVRAFVNHPQLLLMDEPFQSLDEPTANDLRSMLHDLWTETCPTILFVTHNLREALAIADRIIFLSDKPAQIILDFMVDVARPRQLEGKAMTTLHTQLLAQYPNLLSGSIQ